jgi:hypothetical protein
MNSKVERLTKALLADRKNETKPDSRIISCFSCGYRFIKTDSLFCSNRCRDWFDAGHAINIRPERNGSIIRCAYCRKEFESRGLRCCSADCERGLKEHRDNLAVLAEAGIEVALKRTCQQCGAIIPKWTAGKKTPSTKRFCSAKCAQRARRAEEAILKPTT